MWKMRGHMGIYLRLSRHPRGTDNPFKCSWFLNDDHLLLISRIAMMAQVTLTSSDLFARWIEVTVIKDTMGNGSRSYDHLQVCPGKCGPCSRGTHIFKVNRPPCCSIQIRSLFSSST